MRVKDRFSTIGHFRRMLVVATLVYCFIWVLFRLQTPLAEQAQQFVQAVLANEISSDAFAFWEDVHFNGKPALIPTYQDHTGQDILVNAPGSENLITPVRGKIIANFSKSEPYVVIQTQEGAFVDAMAAGRIIFAGQKIDTGYTLVIQHPNGLLATYGDLMPFKWQADDWVTAGEVIGQAEIIAGHAKGLVYVAVMKNGAYINPADVVAFD